MEMETELAAETKTRPSRTRFMAVMAVILLAGMGAGVYWWHLLQTTISTENAKVVADISDISFRVAGRLDQILVSDGEPVQAGQELASLDKEQLRIAREQAQAVLDIAVANYQKLPYDLESKAMAVQKARDQVAIADVSVTTAQTALEDARRLLAKNQDLFASGAISEEALNTAKSNFQKAEAALESARLSRDSYQTGLKDSQQQQAAAGATSEPVLLAGIKQAQAGYDVADYNYNNASLKAPFAGKVVRIAAQAGETVSSGQTVLSLAQGDNTWINANIEEKKVNRLQPGQRVDIRIDTDPGKVFSGTVESVGDVSQSTFALFSNESTAGSFTKVNQRVPVKIAVDTQGLVFRAGTSAQVKIYTE
ncbi:MAG: HlyD family secretion protein [Syntrophomonadaceae bacterium]